MATETKSLSSLTSMMLNSRPYTDEELATMQANEESRKRAAEIEGLVSRANLPKRHHGAIRNGFKSEHPKWTSNLEFMRSRIGKGVVLAMLGKRGTGKTQAAAQLVIEQCNQCRSARYISAMSFYIELRSTYRDDADDTERKVLDRFAAPKLLVIDEVHERGDTPWVDRMLTYLVDRRYQDTSDTILIANQTPEEFAASVGSSVVDRASEGGGIVIFDWASFRSTKK